MMLIAPSMQIINVIGAEALDQVIDCRAPMREAPKDILTSYFIPTATTACGLRPSLIAHHACRARVINRRWRAYGGALPIAEAKGELGNNLWEGSAHADRQCTVLFACIMAS